MKSLLRMALAGAAGTILIVGLTYPDAARGGDRPTMQRHAKALGDTRSHGTARRARAQSADAYFHPTGPTPISAIPVAEAARQAGQVAAARQIPLPVVLAMITASTQRWPARGTAAEYVNLLALNLELDVAAHPR